jgi:hypothetical protein
VDARAVDEHLVEQCSTRHLPQRTGLDARLRHVELEVRDPLVLRQVGVGARDQHADVGQLRGRRPHLLAGDDPLVAVTHGLGLQAREIGPRAGLREQLAPRVLAVEDAQQVFLLLAFVAVRGDGRRGEQVAEAGGRADGAGVLDRGADGVGEAAGPALAPRVLREGRRGVARAREAVPPLAHREVGVPVVGEPSLDLGLHLFRAG